MQCLSTFTTFLKNMEYCLTCYKLYVNDIRHGILQLAVFIQHDVLRFVYAIIFFLSF